MVLRFFLFWSYRKMCILIYLWCTQCYVCCNANDLLRLNYATIRNGIRSDCQIKMLMVMHGSIDCKRPNRVCARAHFQLKCKLIYTFTCHSSVSSSESFNSFTRFIDVVVCVRFFLFVSCLVQLVFVWHAIDTIKIPHWIDKYESMHMFTMKIDIWREFNMCDDFFFLRLFRRYNLTIVRKLHVRPVAPICKKKQTVLAWHRRNVAPTESVDVSNYVLPYCSWIFSARSVHLAIHFQWMFVWLCDECPRLLNLNKWKAQKMKHTYK